ncbi:splicing factor 3A subunit 1 [Pyrus ussuriensis x Pyrus communis]|uniref:Splicing factor 3A subunit 1 n=1 Tax=Pyrus ussuriensis x Pyrus communis TaxID=2448454 RepID=A0A5N5FD32_9ROSA|nr:splicing factor 3A subunit 1 [Pyrus ussuriensis x Pyrus communis]
MSLSKDPASDGSFTLAISESKTTSHTRIIGVIRPPQDIRTIVDKTAHFVAKNGPEFVKRIVVENSGNSKFDFLSSLSPYHAYYQHRLSEFRDRNQQHADSAAPELAAPPAPASDGGAGSPTPDPSAQFKTVQEAFETPEAEQYAVRIPEGITGEELDIVKLTAQFMARNGKSFLAGLTSREIKNSQFSFLKPGSVMFAFFTSLADAYSNVLMPPEGLTEKLRRSVADMETWEQSQEKERRKVEDEIERERIQMAMIEWFDFVVVERVDFADNEDEYLPSPMTVEEVSRRIRVTDTEEDVVEFDKEIEMEMDNEEMQLVEEGLATKDVEEPMRVVKNWKRPEERIRAERDSKKYVMSEYMRISLIDPKFKEQKERMFAKIRDTTLAQDDEISRNIMGLARTRPDIFGTTEEEVSNAVRVEIEKKKDEQEKQVIWDGHTGTIGFKQNYVLNNDARNLPGPTAPPPKLNVPSARTPPPPPGPTLNLPCVPLNTVPYFKPMQVPRACIPLPLSLPAMQLMPPPPLPQVMPPPPPPRLSTTSRRCSCNSHQIYMLIPEDRFLAQHRGPVCIRVSVPSANEGSLKGQFLEITVQSLSESVVKLKEKISTEIQFPANKQKLSGKPGFLKDNLSLAYYIVGAGETLTLSVRKRGGRKR